MKLEPPKIAESYFRTLLNDTSPIEAVTTISRFWGWRLDGDQKYFSLTLPEYYAQLILNYSGNVINGGHLQYFETRGNKLYEDTVRALIEVKADAFANILRKAYTPISNHPDCKGFSTEDVNRLDNSVLDHWQKCDQELYEAGIATSVDHYLQQYLKQNEALILITERSQRAS